MLLVTGILSFASTSASAVIGYVGIQLSVYNGYVNFCTEYKLDRTVGQSYYSSGNINSCTGNENEIMVKISCVGQSIETKTLSKGNTKNWTTEAAKICTRYNLQVKNNVLSPCTSTHSGVWTHN
ncbi:MAG: hypothetical protein GX758_03700 [Tenericutes bacterium]|nr:hypothetical protein [Mycoplasmatota bacterium]